MSEPLGYVHPPAGDMPDAQREHLQNTYIVEDEYRKLFKSLKDRQKARLLVVLSYDYIMGGFEERADRLLMELDEKYPKYLAGELAEDIEKHPDIADMANAVAEYYFNKRYGK